MPMSFSTDQPFFPSDSFSKCSTAPCCFKFLQFKTKPKSSSHHFHWLNWFYHFTVFLPPTPHFVSMMTKILGAWLLAKWNFNGNESKRRMQNLVGGNYSFESLAHVSNPMGTS